MNQHFFYQQFFDYKIFRTQKCLDPIFHDQKFSDPILSSFKTEIFLMKDFVVWRLRGKRECGFAQLYLFYYFFCNSLYGEGVSQNIMNDDEGRLEMANNMSMIR